MAKLLLVGFGTLALSMGAVFGWIGWTGRARAEHAAELVILDASAVAEADLGIAGYVEGHLAERNPIRYDEMVLYFRSVLQGFSQRSGNRQPVWKPLDRNLPALWIETRDGEVRVFGDYSVTFQGQDPVLITTEDLEPGNSERYEGLASSR